MSTIDDVRLRLDDACAFVSPDRLFAAGLAMFRLTGYPEDGTNDRGGATISFDRMKIGDTGLPITATCRCFAISTRISYGKKTAKG